MGEKELIQAPFCVLAVDPGLSGAVCRLGQGFFSIRRDFKAREDIAYAIRELSDEVTHAVIENVHAMPGGAYTGEVADSMLLDLGCRFVILGHSERRALCGENDALVNAKTKASLGDGLVPIVCVGETLEEREEGRTADVVTTQVRGSLAGIPPAELARVVVAYEPVWAIGTGKVATPAQAQEVHALVRGLLGGLSDAATAAGIRILYGGSVKPDNAAALAAQADIDGALVGGASLKAADFLAIAQAFARH